MTTMSNTRTAALPFSMPATSAPPRPTAPRASFSMWRVWWSIREFFWQAWLVVR